MPDALAPASAHRCDKSGRPDKLRDRRRQGIRILRRHEKPGNPIDDRFAEAANFGGDDRFPCRHRFERSHTQPLVQRRHRQHIHPGEELRRICDKSQETHLSGDAQAPRVGLQLRAQRAIARDLAMNLQPLRLEQCRRLEQILMSFALLKCRQTTDGNAFSANRPCLDRGILVGIDATRDAPYR